MRKFLPTLIITVFIITLSFFATVQVAQAATCNVTSSVNQERVSYAYTLQLEDDVEQFSQFFPIVLRAYSPETDESFQAPFNLNQNLCKVSGRSCTFRYSVAFGDLPKGEKATVIVRAENVNLNCQSAPVTITGSKPKDPTDDNDDQNDNSDNLDIEPLDVRVSDQTLDALNPLKITDSPYADQFSTPGGILSRVLEFAFPIAGIILFVMIVWGGFEILMGAANKKSMDAGRQRVTAAIIGFILLFCAYWIAQIMEVLFNIKIL